MTAVDRVEGVEAVASALDALRSVPSSVFQTGPWLRAWSAAWEPDAPVWALRAWRDGVVSGLLPLAVLRRRLHPRLPVAVGYVGVAGSTGGADHVGPVATDAESVGRLLEAARADATRRRPLLLEHLTTDTAAIACTVWREQAAVVRETRCPALDLGDEPERQWRPRVARSIRRRARLLADAGWSVRLETEPAAVIRGLDDLRRLHEARWGDQILVGSFDDRRLALVEQLVASWDRPDGPALQVLRHDDGAVGAAQLLLRHDGTWSVYKTGWDPALAPLGPGVHLAVEAVRAAAAAGARRVDFLRGTSAYKYSLGATDRVDRSVADVGSLAGRVLAARERWSERRAIRVSAASRT